ncbi:MAG TPA: hypothetical protein VKD47_05025 [Miltoncostaeaceae bacterium]|nr:hypothetical protein [Miltoncostaeaceae bacterium]
MPRFRIAVAVLAAVLGAGAAGAAAAPTAIVYEKTQHAYDVLVRGPEGLAHNGGLVQEPSGDNSVWGPRRTAHYRLAKINYHDLLGLGTDGMVALIRSKVDAGCGAFGCASNQVAIDEIGAEFSDGPPPKVKPRGFRSRAAARRAGRYPDNVVLPPVNPASPGARLTEAMKRLAVMPWPGGGSYADRVQFYLAPTVTTSIGKGQGRNQNLGRDGRPHFSTWRGVMPGLALGGGIWLEMYHGKAVGAGHDPFMAVEWRRYPRDVVSMFQSFGGAPEKVHFMIANTPVMPRKATECGGLTPMACVWKLAGLAGANRQILMNGAGAYQVGGQAAEWLSLYRQDVLAAWANSTPPA